MAGFCAVFTTVIVFAADKDAWIGLLFISLFWAIGIGMMLGGINMARRRAVSTW